MAANKTIGGINVTITATIDKFAKNITAARKLVGGMVSSIKGLVFNLKTLGLALASGAFVKLVSDQFDAINSLKDLSDKTGVSTDKLAGLQLAAEEAGIPISLLEKSLVKLNNEYGTRGDLALRQWIEKTSQLETHQQKLAAATEMFGSKGSSMVRFLQGGTAALDEAQRAAESMGLAVSQDVAIGVDRASEAFARLKMNMQGVFMSLAGEIAPYVELLSVKTMEMIANNGGGSGVGKFIADVIIEMSKNVVDLIQKMVTAGMESFHGLQVLIATFRSGVAAKGLGLGFRNPRESMDAFIAISQGAKRIEEFKANNWAGNMQKWIDDARAQSAVQAAESLKSFATKGPDLLDMAGGFAKKMLGPMATNVMGAGKGLGGMFSRQFGWMQEAAKYIDISKAGQRPGLSFAESGSVESYRQQAAIRAQRDTMKLDKDRNGLLKDIRDGIKQQPQLAAAGLG